MANCGTFTSFTYNIQFAVDKKHNTGLNHTVNKQTPAIWDRKLLFLAPSM